MRVGPFDLIAECEPRPPKPHGMHGPYGAPESALSKPSYFLEFFRHLLDAWFDQKQVLNQGAAGYHLLASRSYEY
jgi:hypothetical protein